MIKTDTTMAFTIYSQTHKTLSIYFWWSRKLLQDLITTKDPITRLLLIMLRLQSTRGDDRRAVETCNFAILVHFDGCLQLDKVRPMCHQMIRSTNIVY